MVLHRPENGDVDPLKIERNNMRATNPAPDLIRIALQIERSYRIADRSRCAGKLGRCNAGYLPRRARWRRQICP